MSYNGHQVVDMDSHIRQYWDLDATYKDRMDPEYRETYAQFSEAAHALQRFPGDRGFDKFLWPALPSRPLGMYEAFELLGENDRNETLLSRSSTNAGIEIDPSCNWDPVVRLRDMDTAGIDLSVMFPSSSDSFCSLRDPGFEGALNRAYNRYISEYCADSERLFWIGGATMRDIPESVAQLQKWTKEDNKFAGVQISRTCPDGRQLDNPALHPLFAASEALDMPIWIHGGANRPPFTPWQDAPNGLYHSIGGMYAMAALIGGGVFDLFPKLRIGLFESFGGWVPYMVEKLDDGYIPGSTGTPRLKRTASEIIADGNLFCSVEADEKHLPYAVESLGEDMWLFSTDYPHNGSPWPNGVPMIEEMPMPESAKIKLLGENGVRFLPRLTSVGAK
jgi:predicted TIM-barrel fold metal-dependent hydrolase